VLSLGPTARGADRFCFSSDVPVSMRGLVFRGRGAGVGMSNEEVLEVHC
jgi:hypothetical protein